METTHTPGPWCFVEGDYATDQPYIGVPGKVICDIGQRAEDDEGQPLQYEQHPQDTANARLIASAPDLLAACEAIMPHLDSDLLAHEPWLSEIEAMRAAIAKAQLGAA